MKKPPLGGSGQEAESDLNLPATTEERRTLAGWLSEHGTWQFLVVAGACRPHRVSKAASQLWAGRVPKRCSRTHAYLYTWREMQEIAAYLGQRKWR